MIKDQVFWLYISMYDTLLVDCLQCFDETSDEELCLIMWKLSYGRVMVPEITTLHQVHNKVKHALVMEGILNIHNKLRVESTHKFKFLHN